MSYTHYLTFTLDEQSYGVPIEEVREIIQMVEITPVPQTSPAVIGVINMRGRILSVVDLRVKFNLETADYTKQSCILVMEVEDEYIGAVVDSVEEVKEFTGENFEDKPSLVDEQKITHVIGIGKEGSEVVILVNLSEALKGIKTPDGAKESSIEEETQNSSTEIG